MPAGMCLCNMWIHHAPGLPRAKLRSEQLIPAFRLLALQSIPSTCAIDVCSSRELSYLLQLPTWSVGVLRRENNPKIVHFPVHQYFSGKDLGGMWRSCQMISFPPRISLYGHPESSLFLSHILKYNQSSSSCWPIISSRSPISIQYYMRYCLALPRHAFFFFLHL